MNLEIPFLILLVLNVVYMLLNNRSEEKLKQKISSLECEIEKIKRNETMRSRFYY